MSPPFIKMSCFITILSLLISSALGLTVSVNLPGGLLPISTQQGNFNAIIENYPYTVTLRNYETVRCGGAMISNKAVLTAGHCVDGVIKQFADVRVGATYRAVDGTIVPIKRFSLHPGYVKKNLIENDIAVVILLDSVIFSAKVQPIGLPAQNEALPYGAYGYVTGFGRTTASGVVPTQLQALRIPVLQDSACQTAYGAAYKANMLCGGSNNGTGSFCPQESGDPFVISGKVFGLKSSGTRCDLPAVYTNVPYFSDWVVLTMNL